jgi:hypothetical protein
LWSTTTAAIMVVGSGGVSVWVVGEGGGHVWWWGEEKGYVLLVTPNQALGFADNLARKAVRQLVCIA